METDEDLVTAVRRGDDRAFELLYGRYQRRISSYVYGMVNDHGRAEDITQEIFMSALRRMRDSEGTIAFKPWIYEISKNACIDQFRRSRRAEEVSFDADDGAGALEAARLSSATPDAAIDAKQQLDDLCGAFRGLSDTHHEILLLRELEGLTYREIGERLGLSRPSVESTLFRARRSLTKEYDELVSGERCRRVSEMLGSGMEGLGARDERRLARHVAHCQPCRRQAYAAGVDTATLTRFRGRKVASRVAALVPIPAFLRPRRAAGGSLTDHHGVTFAQYSGTLTNLAEPAVGWAKAAAATAAVVMAGGAGVATHDPSPSAPANVAPVTAPAPAPDRAAGGRMRGSAPEAGRELRPTMVTTRPQQRAAAAPRSSSRPSPAGRAVPASRPAVAPSSGRPAAPAAPAAVAPNVRSQGTAAPPVNPDNPSRPAHSPTAAVPALPEAVQQATDGSVKPDEELASVATAATSTALGSVG